jgi:hypothetical protein
MRDSPLPARPIPAPSSLLVRFRTEQTAFVYLPPDALFIVATASGQIQSPCLLPVLVPRLLPRRARIYISRVTIGRERQTR